MADDPLPSPRGRRVRAPGAYLALPLWQRYALSAAVAVVLLVAMVIYVSGHNTDSPTSQNLLASARANREAEILIAQDQAPHVVHLAPRLAPADALARAVLGVLAERISSGALDGPIQSSRCRPTGPGATGGSRRAFSCVVEVGDVNYPFLGVVDQAARQVIYCKRDAPPVPSDKVPVSALCLG